MWEKYLCYVPSHMMQDVGKISIVFICVNFSFYMVSMITKVSVKAINLSQW